MASRLFHNFYDQLTYNLFSGLFQLPAQKSSWTEPDSTTKFSYPVTSEVDSYLSSKDPYSLSSIRDPPMTSHQDNYLDQNYTRTYDSHFEDQYQYDQQDHQYQDGQYQEKQENLYISSYDQKYQDDHKSQLLKLQDQQFPHQQPNLFPQPELQHQEPKLTPEQQFQEDQMLKQQQQLYHQQQQLLQHQQQQQQQQQAKQAAPAQQLQTTVLTGAATLGSFMAGGAKKLGSLFGAAAAAVATPAVSQPITAAPVSTAPINQFTSSVAVTPFPSTTVPFTTSVPEVPTSMPVTIVTTSQGPITLPRTPSLRRQESLQRPPVRRTRTLPDAPEDMQASFDESAYEDEYNKTEFDEIQDRTSLDRYREDEYHDAIIEEAPDEIERRLSDLPSPSIQKTASPTRTVSITRKASVDSYQSHISQTPSITIDRRISQSSFHHEEKLIVPTTQEGTYFKNCFTAKL